MYTVTYHGVTQRSYAELWEWIINEWLRLSDQGYSFNEGQTLVLRTYLERNSEKKEQIISLYKKGIAGIPLQGELTPESNYSPAEGLARNYLIAQQLYKELTGNDHASLKVAWLYDAFGNGPNHPQILKLAGAEAVGGTKYRKITDDDYWHVIDGTIIPCIDKKLSNYYYVWSKHPPCPSCNGKGCNLCEGHGMIAGLRFTKKDCIKVLEKAANENSEKSFVFVGGEEALPDQCIIDSITEMNKKYSGQIKFRFGLFSDFWNFNRKEYLENQELFTGPVHDLNPVHAGCYTTRIRTKQDTYKAIYALLQAEAKIASEAWHNGRQKSSPFEFRRAWQDLLLTIHHDSI